MVLVGVNLTERIDRPYYNTAWSESGITMTSVEVKANSIETAINVAGEGIVLLKNDNNSLPLKQGDGAIKVNVFGASFLDPEFAGGGGADITVECLGFYDALKNSGISYNEELYSACKNWYDQYNAESPYAGGVEGNYRL